jgi:alginate O-acetyltransferase complex protein AlgI
MLKLLLPGKYLMEMYAELTGPGWNETSLATGWMVMLCLALGLYYQLSGWCDMAQGIGAMFNFKIPLNFYYPYQSRSAGDFVQRFNSTVWSFLHRNVYETLKSAESPAATEILCLLLMGMLFGLWFGFSVNYLLWGVFLILVRLIERTLLLKLSVMVPVLIRRVITFGVVMFSFTLMAADTAGAGLSHMRGMLGLGGLAGYNEIIMYQLTTNWMLLLLAGFLCTNAVNLLVLWAHRNAPRTMDGLLAAANAALLVILTAIIY